MSQRITTHRELDVYKKAFDAAMVIFEVTRNFPREEIYSLTDQFRRSSRSVCANLAEAWRKRRYEKAFIAKLSDAETEATETQVWIEFAVKCNYLSRDQANHLYRDYDEITRMIVATISQPTVWLIPIGSQTREEGELYGEPF